MNRYVLMGLKNWYRIPGWAIQVAVRNKNLNHKTHEDNYRFIRKMVMRINRTGRVQVEVSGLENLPEEQGYVLFPNHEGFFDSMALIEACEKPFYLVAMKEIMEIPFLNYLFHMFRVKLMDRADLRQSFRVIEEVTKEVKSGKNYVIFAEGTLEEQENLLRTMKPGAFKSAMKAERPVVPVAIKDSFLPFDRKGINLVTVKVMFLPTINASEYQGKNTREVAGIVEERIQKVLAEYSQNDNDY